MSVIWIDVEDLFIYAAHHARPTGIQRLQFELCRALAECPAAPQSVRFVRHDTFGRSFVTISWRSVERLWEELTAGRSGVSAPALEAEPAGRDIRQETAEQPLGAARRLLYRLPLAVRVPFLKSLRYQLDAVRQFGFTFSASLRVVADSLRRPTAVVVEVEHELLERFDQHAAPGDTLVALGSPWSNPDYGALGASLRRERGLRFAVLVYDIVVLRRPEWCDPELIPVFSRWLRGILPVCDTVLCISDATSHDVVRYAAEQDLQLLAAPVTIPIGSGFTPSAAERAAASPSPRAMPTRPYALIVSTIEARKNHILLFHVWRRLLDEMPTDSVPTLVFAGRPGWLVEDLMQQMRNADMLGGRIVLFASPTDLELELLYRGCLFTLFPSFYEGWGLPVTESLAYGRPCLISNATSLPEAGGSFARYFDPNNTSEAFDVIRATIEDRQGLQAWQQRIDREFRPVPWSRSANAVLAALGVTSRVSVSSGSHQLAE